MTLLIRETTSSTRKSRTRTPPTTRLDLKIVLASKVESSKKSHKRKARRTLRICHTLTLR